MTQEQIQEGNKIIAEFMGHTIRKDGRVALKDREPLTNEYIVGMKYHYSWDWLMPVVEKIESLHNGIFSFFIVQTECDIATSSSYMNNKELDAPNFRQKLGDKLTSTWYATVNFIKWHNENIKS